MGTGTGTGNDNDILTVDEAAEWLRVPPSRVEKYIREGLPAVAMCGSGIGFGPRDWRIFRGDLVEWLKSRRVFGQGGGEAAPRRRGQPRAGAGSGSGATPKGRPTEL